MSTDPTSTPPGPEQPRGGGPDEGEETVGGPAAPPRAGPPRRGPRCSGTRGSPSTWPSSPGCGTPVILVAAGPLTDVPGEGMTILRLPGAGQLDRATELATKDDSSVAGGFFTVTVRPWQVMFQAGR